MHTINRFKEHIKSIFSASKESITMIHQRQIFLKNEVEMLEVKSTITKMENLLEDS